MSDGWRRHGSALAVVGAGLLTLFWRDAADLARIWWTSSTFNHCLLIPPIIAWLVWQRWPELRRIAPGLGLPGLALSGAGALGWLMGEAAGVAFARHLGLVMMFQGAAITLLGKAVSRAIAFPIGYALFLVPFGEQLVPPLQTLTARICMVLLDLTGVPAHIEGVFITIPNGWFEVAEACSGVKFLIAMAAYGVLVANVCFLSWRRRLVFVTAALVLPIVANGVRAWGTIYMAHLTNARSAVGFDHVVYGWIFFAIVIALLMGSSWRFFDRPAGAPWTDGKPSALPRGSFWPGAVAAWLVPAFAAGWSAFVAEGVAAPVRSIAMPSVAGWRAAPPPVPLWKPHFAGADAIRLGHYRDGKRRTVSLALAVYARQAEGRELVGFGQGAIGADSPWAWTEDRPAPAGGRAFRMTGPGAVVRDVMTFYRVGDVTTGSEIQVKIETLKARLTGKSQCAAAVILVGPDRGSLEDFLARLGSVKKVADRLCAA